VLTSREEMGTVTLGVARMVGEFRIAWPMLMAGSLLGALPSVIFYVALQRFLISGMTADAVKQSPLRVRSCGRPGQRLGPRPLAAWQLGRIT
jgi:hypothetical protein